MIDISLRARMHQVIEQVRYPGYNFGLHYGINDDSVYLQASYWEPDVHAPDDLEKEIVAGWAKWEWMAKAICAAPEAKEIKS